jgi:hypothetical protein
MPPLGTVFHPPASALDKVYVVVSSTPMTFMPLCGFELCTGVELCADKPLFI